MYEIPKPELLNPDRIDRDDRENFTVEDHRSRAQLLAKALGESCAYADQLWEQVNALRAYLLDSLPPDPRAPGPHAVAASPTGPDDEVGWTRWINAFATTTSVLCGSHGDSGFGLSRGREEAQLRRSAPEVTLLACHAELATPRPATSAIPASPPSPAHEVEDEQRRQTPTASAAVKAAAITVIGVLALRGLRTPHRTPKG